MDGNIVMECFQEHADAYAYCNAQEGYTLTEGLWVGESRMDYMTISTYRLWGAGESVEFTHDGPTI